MLPNKTKKCGEILMDINTRNKIDKVFLFNCAFCNIEYDHFNTFSLHIEEHLDISEYEFKEPINEFQVEPGEISMQVFTNEQNVNSEDKRSFVITDIKKEPEIKEDTSAFGIEEENPEILDIYGEQFLVKEPFVLTDIKKEPEHTNAFGIEEENPEIPDIYGEQFLVKEPFVLTDIKMDPEIKDDTSTIGIEEERSEILDVHVEQFLAKEPVVLTDIKNSEEDTNAININVAEPEEITHSTFTKVEKLNNEVSISDIKKEAESEEETSAIGIGEERSEIPDIYGKKFVITDIEKKTESYDNTSDIDFLEENLEIVNFNSEQFVIKEIKLDDEDTQKTDCIEDAPSIMTIDDSEDDSHNDSSEIIEIVIENGSSDSENETLQQIEHILNNKRKTTTCNSKGTEKPKRKDLSLKKKFHKPFNIFDKNGKYVRELDYCNKRCKSRITLDQQLYIFNQFWNIKSNEGKYNFIAKLILKKNATDHHNQFKHKYFLQLPDQKILVCKKCFMYTLCIREGNIKTAIKKFCGETFRQNYIR